VAKDMGAEFIIGIHLNSAPLPTDSVLSSFSIMVQSFNAVIASNERRGMQLADILVTVDVANFGNTDYDEGAKIIQRGYEAAEKNAAALSRFALDESEWQQHLAQRDAKRLNSVPVPTFVQVQGTTEELAKSITRQLDGAKGRALDEDELERKLTLLSGTGRFSGLGYQVTPVDGNYGLQINASEKQYGPPTINPIIIIDGSQYNNVRFTAGGRLTLMDIGKAGSELRTDVLAGSTYRLASEYFRPWGSSIHWFMLPHAGAESSSVDIYSRNTRLAEYRESQLDAGMDVGYMFDRFSQLSFGYDAGYLKYSPNIGDRQTLPSVSGRQGIIGAHYVTDHLDQPVVPEKGIAAVSDFGFYEARPSAADGFPALKSSIQFFKPLPKRGSLYFGASGGTTFGFSHTGVPPFSLGGPLRLSAYGTNEIFTNQYMLYQLGYLHPIAQLPPIMGKKVYFLSVYEIAKPYGTFGKLATSRLPMDIAGGVIFETLFGPVQVGGSWGDSGHRKVYFALGRVF
jgi:NTE family protein